MEQTNKPDEVLGLNSRGFDASSNDAGASDVNSPADTRLHNVRDTNTIYRNNPNGRRAAGICSACMELYFIALQTEAALG